MNKKNIILLLLIVCFTMCKQKTPQSDHFIAVDMDRPETVSFFDYFSSIELVQLENSSNALVSAISKFIVFKDNFYLLDKRQCVIFVFNQTGEYLFKIDNKGNGPGEYSFIQDFNINPFSGNIELLEPYGSVHIYDLSGNYFETKRIIYPDFTAVHKFAIIDNKTHVFHAHYTPEMIIYYNLDDNVLLHKEYKEDRNLSYYAYKNVYSYQDDWFVYRPVNPFVYKIGMEKLEIAFQFDFGKYTREGLSSNFTEEGRRNRNKLLEEWFAQFPYAITTVRHNRHYLFTTLVWKEPNRMANIIYDQYTGKSKFILDFAEKVEFDPEVVTDEYVFSICHWVDLKKYISKEMLNDLQKEIFESLLQSTNETNPVLIKFRFK